VALGARSTISLPLSAEGRNIGALNLYSRSPDAFSSEAVSVAEIIAAHSGLATQVAGAYFSHRDLADQLRTAMSSREVIDQAKGILMGSRRIGPTPPSTCWSTCRSGRNRKLRDVAQALVDDAVNGTSSL
jgi:hypothetical protein